MELSISLASELGSLSVKELELKTKQDALEETKKILAEKVRMMTEATKENKVLRKQVEVGKQALKDTKILLWNCVLKEVKKLKDFLLMLQDEKALIETYQTNVSLVQEMVGDKPIQA